MSSTDSRGCVCEETQGGFGKLCRCSSSHTPRRDTATGRSFGRRTDAADDQPSASELYRQNLDAAFNETKHTDRSDAEPPPAGLSHTELYRRRADEAFEAAKAGGRS